MSSLRCIPLVLSLIVAACASTEPAPTLRTAREQPAHVATEPPAASVSIELRAPSRARWLSSTLSPARPPLDVVVKNRSAAAVDVSDLRLHLEAVRESVAFQCAAEVGPGAGAREPAMLMPGETFVFERAIDCSLPLTGHYDVRISVSFGHGKPRAPLLIRDLALDVKAPERPEPRPVAAIPGLYGAIGSSSLLVGESGHGSGRIAVALVNGSPHRVTLPRLRLVMQVFRAGSPIPCEDEPMELAAPATLEPGETYRAPVDVSCLGLDAPGRYDVVVRLRIGDGDLPLEQLNPLRVEISNDPARRTPPLLLR